MFWHVSYAPPLPHVLTNLVKEGEVTGDSEEGGGEDNLGLKELGLIVRDCSRQAEWLCCDIQLYPAALADNDSALNNVTSMCPCFSWLVLLLNEAIKCNNFYLSFAHLKTKLNFLKSALALQAPEN